METLENLIKNLREIKKRGFIKSLRKGSTGIGYTLETLLDISENRSRDPDWGEYEIKTKREKKTNNTSLFVPKWRYVHYNNWREMVRERGEPYQSKDGQKRGFALLHGAPYGEAERNGWKIDFNLDGDLSLIHNKEIIATVSKESLIRNFVNKFQKVVWVYADFQFDSNGIEEFYYKEAYLLENSSYDKFIELVKENKIVLELRLYYFTQHPNGKEFESHGNAFRSKDGVIFELFNTRKRIL